MRVRTALQRKHSTDEAVRALPYSAMAWSYDHAIGLPFFWQHRRAFEMVVRRHGVRFHSAVDLGCGTGLFACYLSRCWGVPVIGVDRAEEMLKVARCNCRAPNVHFIRQDIRELRLPCPVDLATCNFDTLNHLVGNGDLPRVFARVHASLNPGGHFFFDMVTPANPWQEGFVQVRRFRQASCLITQRIRWSPRLQLLTAEVVHQWPAPRPAILELHRERAYPPEQLNRWLTNAGFVVREVIDAMTLRMPRVQPIRMIVLAKK